MATYKKKLIEVSLPLPEVNDASAYDKMPGIGPHPKGIHHWWARLPLPTARAVLFTSVVDDPSEHPEIWPNQQAQDTERERLFAIVRRMMSKRLHDRPDAYLEARVEMLKWTGGESPAVFDPFAGGGSIPLEANRLGFEAHAGDLNPVAVLLNKCNLEIAPIWTGQPPVNSQDRLRIGGTDTWRGTYGLAADVRFYGRVILDKVRKQVGQLYPTVRLPKSHGGLDACVIAWIWARTVSSPDPAGRGTQVPLMSTFWLSSKKGGETWLKPIVDRAKPSWRFEVRAGSPDDRAAVKAGTKTGRAQFRCLLTGTAISDDYVKSEGAAGRMGVALVAIVADTGRARMYLAASETHTNVAQVPVPEGELDEQLALDPRNIWCVGYGLDRFSRLFTPRQLTTLLALSKCIKEITNDVKSDALAASLDAPRASAYANAVTTFLALSLDRCADFNNSLCRWKPSGQQSMQLFGRQAIPMVWDFVEPNLMGEKAVCWQTAIDICAAAIESIAPFSTENASARQIDAATGANGLSNLLVSTDPPYYDNISYASLSDFFYVWLRRSIGGLYPELFGTVLVPKVSELTAAPERFDGDKQRAKQHFESGFRRAFTALREKMDSRFPLTVYYAYKQSDDEGSNDGLGNDDAPVVDLTTGWETLLEALIASGFQITATWPVRASQAWRMRAMSSNALASYIVLACRPRAADAPQSGRREFLAELRKELPAALRHLQQGNVAPVDFAQAAIGPGMSIYSRYSRILESNGRPMSVRAALGLINQIKDEILGEPEADYDPSTRWAIAWYDQHGFETGDFGDANTLATAHAIAVGTLQEAEIVEAREGKVRLLRADELEEDWEPEGAERPSIWRMTHQLVRSYFADKRGDVETAALLRELGGAGESARDLAYRLHSIAERRKRSQDAQGYNALVLGWPEIARLAQSPAEPLGQVNLL